MFTQSDIKKLERFGKGLSDEAENQYIYSLFSEYEGDREFKHYFLSEWQGFIRNDKEDDYDISHLLDRVHHKINSKGNRKSRSVFHKAYQWYSVAAAVLLIPLLIASGIWVTISSTNKTQEVELLVENPVTSILFAPLGSRINFSLPDGTNGWLNSGSSLEYKLPFSNNRKINLLGEAWFDVAHDNNHPFEIVAGNSKVKVLGTKFNLNAYPEDNYVEVVLEDGMVEFSTQGLLSQIEIKSNERLVLKEGSININVTDTYKYSAWKEGKLIFRGAPMAEVARRIERWYNVKVKLVDKELENYVYRGVFQDNSLNEVLKYLCMTSPIKYRIIERKDLNDNNYQKRKVLLYKKNNSN